MSFELWLAFLVASAVLVASPGAVVVYGISQTSRRGRGAIGPILLGTAAGDLLLISAALAGLGALLASSGGLFDAVRYAGAAYLLAIGVRQLVAIADAGTKAPIEAGVSKSLFFQSFFLTALHPGGLVFFLAFLPLFFDPDQDFWPQYAILTATFVGIAAATLALWLVAAAAAANALKQPRIQKGFQLLSGLWLCALAAAAFFLTL